MNRASGVLMHVSSLFGEHSIGSFGKEAINFIDFLSDCGFSYWQVLPFCAARHRACLRRKSKRSAPLLNKTAIFRMLAAFSHSRPQKIPLFQRALRQDLTKEKTLVAFLHKRLFYARIYSLPLSISIKQNSPPSKITYPFGVFSFGIEADPGFIYKLSFPNLSAALT